MSDYRHHFIYCWNCYVTLHEFVLWCKISYKKAEYSVCFFQTGGANMSWSKAVKLPKMRVFAGPNRSGKTIVTKMAKFLEVKVWI